MKILLVGLGSIGTRHAQILRTHFAHEMKALRHARGNPVNTLGIPELYSWQEVDAYAPEVAFIANETHAHIKTALACAKRGMHLFIEKPLSHTLEGINELSAVCGQKKLICYTAFCLRFHPVIKKIRMLLEGKKLYHARVICASYLPQWRPGQDWKKSYFASKEKGGGALLDLSHELDYIQYLFSPIKEATATLKRVSNVTIDAEDCVDSMLMLENGLTVNLHLDLFSLKTQRRIDVDFEDGYLTADLIDNTAVFSDHGQNETFTFPVDRDAYLLEQDTYFFNSIDNPGIAMNGLAESASLLKKILEMKNA